jgi:hypothetical protein
LGEPEPVRLGLIDCARSRFSAHSFPPSRGPGIRYAPASTRTRSITARIAHIFEHAPMEAGASMPPRPAAIPTAEDQFGRRGDASHHRGAADLGRQLRRQRRWWLAAERHRAAHLIRVAAHVLPARLHVLPHRRVLDQGPLDRPLRVVRDTVFVIEGLQSAVARTHLHVVWCVQSAHGAHGARRKSWTLGSSEGAHRARRLARDAIPGLGAGHTARAPLQPGDVRGHFLGHALWRCANRQPHHLLHDLRAGLLDRRRPGCG